MAKRYEPELIGIDTGKSELVICRNEEHVQSLSNRTADIKRWLRDLSGPACIAIEATGTYHLHLLELAFAAGHRLYVVDGLRLRRYRESVGGRAKTDLADARLIRRYLQRERDQLRPWEPPPPGYTRLQRLLHRRARLVQMRTALTQSLAEVPDLRATCRTLLTQLGTVVQRFDQALRQAAVQTGLGPDLARLRAVEGVGPITSVALANAFRRGRFRHSDAFIAFLGMAVRMRDSGRSRGRRKLTKQGDPELRRLLHNAAMAASRKGRWKTLYQAYLARGLTKIQALVILARKLARLAFSLLKFQSDYCPNRHCMQT
jgi:transposase